MRYVRSQLQNHRMSKRWQYYLQMTQVFQQLDQCAEKKQSVGVHWQNRHHRTSYSAMADCRNPATMEYVRKTEQYLTINSLAHCRYSAIIEYLIKSEQYVTVNSPVLITIERINSIRMYLKQQLQLTIIVTLGILIDNDNK